MSRSTAIRMCEVNLNGWTTTPTTPPSAAAAQCGFRRPVGSNSRQPELSDGSLAQQAHQQPAYKHQKQPLAARSLDRSMIARRRSQTGRRSSMRTRMESGGAQSSRYSRSNARRQRPLDRRKADQRKPIEFPEPMNLSATSSPNQANLESPSWPEISMEAARLANGVQISEQLSALIGCHNGRLYAPPTPFSVAAARQQALQFASLHRLSQVASVLQQQQQQQHQQQLGWERQVEPASGQPPAAGNKRPRQSRKCRKMYGMEQRQLWCTQCKWKKACSRFCDHRQRQSSAHPVGGLLDSAASQPHQTR